MYNTYQLSNWHFFYHGFAKEHYIKYNIINSSFKRCVRVVTRILLSTYFCLQLILFENVFVDNFFSVLNKNLNFIKIQISLYIAIFSGSAWQFLQRTKLDYTAFDRAY